MNKCNGLDRNGNQCNLSVLNENDYCKFHQYMSNYTLEQINNLVLCKGCMKWKYFDDNTKTCQECKIRGEENRLKYKDNRILCKKEDCKFEKSNENEYCGKHQAIYFKEQTENLGKKVCYNYLRGCREQLSNGYFYSKCDICLKKDREKDKLRRNKKINVVENIGDNNSNNNSNNDLNNDLNNNPNNNLNNDSDNKNICVNKILVLIGRINENIKKCESKIDDIITYVKCFIDENGNNIKFNLDTPLIQCSDAKCKLYYHASCFVSDTNGSITKRCITCRNKGKIKDHKESRQNSKKIWNEENYEKTIKYWMDYRGKKMEELGEEYWRNNAIQAKNWRDNNPEKVKEINQKKKENINQSYKIYKSIAESKNTEFNILLEQYIEIVKNPCFYCNIIQDKGFNGLDKKICTKGYVLNNVVSCCEICNFMKGTLTPEIFFKRIEHILTNLNVINGNLHPEVFMNHNSKSISYLSYKNKAINRMKVDFEITEEEFNELVNNKCYLCRKENNSFHQNGIDRIDNNIGYIKSNIKACCGNCNYMKNKFDLKKLLAKMLSIYFNLENYEFNDIVYIIKHKHNYLDKITSKEKNKSLEEKRKIQKENMKIKYNDNEYKKNRVYELELLKK
jgi:hypothetical protein